MTSKWPQLLTKNNTWHVIYQTREHERTDVSKVSIKSFKATCLCYDQKTITEAEATRERGQSHQ